MHDELDALRVGVRGQAGQVVVGIRLGERERVAIGDPVAVPAGVPALHQHAADPVRRRKIDVASSCSRSWRRASGPEAQVIVLMCIPHQMPTYFIGLIQSVLGRTFGGLRLRPSTEGARSIARSAIWIVRHGVTNGVRPRTLIPSAMAARSARRVRAFHARRPGGSSGRSPPGSPRGSRRTVGRRSSPA